MELRFEPKFYREHLGEKSDHKSLIQDFQPTRPEGYGLTRYLQDQAFVGEESGNIRTYLIRQKGTGELVGYYSIRAGNMPYGINSNGLPCVKILSRMGHHAVTERRKTGSASGLVEVESHDFNRGSVSTCLR